MMVALLAFISMDWVFSTYTAVGPQLSTFLQSEEFYLPIGAIGLTAMAVLIGWRAKALAIGHRLRNAKALIGEEKNMKVARQLRLEDAILKAIDSMLADKTMTGGQAKNAFTEFANKMGLEGLRLRARTWKPLRGKKLEALRKKTSAGLAALRETPVLPLPLGVEMVPTKRNLLGVVTERTRVKLVA